MDANIHFAPPSLSPALKGGDGGAFITQLGFPDTRAKAQKIPIDPFFITNVLIPLRTKNLS